MFRQDMYLGMTDELSTIQYCTTVPLYDVFGNKNRSTVPLFS